MFAAVTFATGFLFVLAFDDPESAADDMLIDVLKWGIALALFSIALLLPIRRRLELEMWELGAIAACIFAGVSLTQYVIYHVPISVDWLRSVIANDTWFALVTTNAGNGVLYLNNFLDGRPACWPEGSQTCEDQAFAIRELMRFITVMAFACLVLPWRISIVRILSFWVILMVLMIGVVNLAAVIEVELLGETIILGDPGLPQAVLYAAIAFMLARFHIRRPVKKTAPDVLDGSEPADQKA